MEVHTSIMYFESMHFRRCTIGHLTDTLTIPREKNICREREGERHTHIYIYIYIIYIYIYIYVPKKCLPLEGFLIAFVELAVQPGYLSRGTVHSRSPQSPIHPPPIASSNPFPKPAPKDKVAGPLHYTTKTPRPRNFRKLETRRKHRMVLD
jgi:hypothetical protein